MPDLVLQNAWKDQFAQLQIMNTSSHPATSNLHSTKVRLTLQRQENQVLQVARAPCVRQHHPHPASRRTRSALRLVYSPNLV